MGRIFYIMGKSATGKDSIYSELKRDFRLHLQTIILYTTRPIRSSERNGVDYYFIKEEQIPDFLKSGKVIEMRSYETVHGIWRYLTLDDGQFELTHKNYLIIGTLESYEKMQEYFGKDWLIPIYITVEDGIRLGRALQREKQQKKPRYAELCRRYLADEMDFSKEKLTAACITKTFVNDCFPSCVAEIKNYIQAKIQEEFDGQSLVGQS